MKTGKNKQSSGRRAKTSEQEEPLFHPTPMRQRAYSVPLWARGLFTALTGAMMLAVLVLAGYGAYRLLERDPVAPESSTEESTESSSPSSTEVSVLPPTQQEAIAIGPELGLVVEESEEDDEVSLASSGGRTELSAVNIARSILPSVVGISCYARDSADEPYSTGSGFVISKDGYIVTCGHIVENSTRTVVILSNGRKSVAELVGLDTRTDIAVLKIEATSLIPVSFGSSDSLQPGAAVIAIGNPGGAEFIGSITDGILSSPSRSVKISQNSYYTMDALQITAAIDPGNNGGPLCDVYGNVIGLCSSEQRSDEYPSAYFAIPSSVLVPVAEDLVQYGRVTGRVWLGIGAVALSESTARLNGLPSGIMVTTIYEGSNVEDAGLQPNDIILTIDGKVMNSLDDLRTFLDAHSPGDLITMTVYRRGERVSMYWESESSEASASQSEPQSASSGEESDGYMLQIYLYLLEDTGSLVGAFVPE